GAGVESVQERLTPGAADALAGRHGKAEVVVVRYVLEHAHDTPGLLAGLRGLTAPGGYVVVEVPDTTRALGDGDYTTVWEEHTCYFTPATLCYCLQRAGLEVVFLHSYPYPGDNALVAIARVPAGPHRAPPPRPGEAAGEVERARGFLSGFAGHK